MGDPMMSGAVREVLLGIRTVAEMIEVFADEERCRRLVKALVWPNGPGLSGVRLQAFDRVSGARHGPIPGAAGSVPELQWRLPLQFTATTPRRCTRPS